MKRNRVRSAGWLVSILLLGSLSACGGDPAPKGDPTGEGSPSSSGSGPPTSPTAPTSTFPPDAPLPDGPWIPTVSMRVKVPKGFKGESDFGAVALRKGDLGITIYDPGSVGDDTLEGAVKTEKKLDFTGPTKVESGTATVDGRDVQTFRITGKYEFFQRVAYGFGVSDKDGDTRFVVIGFEGEKDPTTQQDVIDSVLSSIQWDQDIAS